MRLSISKNFQSVVGFTDNRLLKILLEMLVDHCQNCRRSPIMGAEQIHIPTYRLDPGAALFGGVLYGFQMLWQLAVLCKPSGCNFKGLRYESQPPALHLRVNQIG
jgi:hypothetical protein